uniref:Core-2/I-Branching enzyme n=1 Tax=Panagrellus redivivus TaxID=6233 RepID=A0A7E4W6G7_PANRE
MVLVALLLFVLLPVAIATTFQPYPRHPSTKTINCDHFLDNDVSETMESDERVRMYDPIEQNLPMDCLSIITRFPYRTKPRSDYEGNFPIAYVRIVFTDYYYLETIFRATYEPQNYYCYFVDSSSNELFHKRINALASCFPNVVVSNVELDLDSNGTNTNAAVIACLEELVKFKDWKYVIMQQNHDVPIKTNREIVDIFKILNGANDIGCTPPTVHIPEADWSMKGMQFFKNKTLNKTIKPNDVYPTKAAMQASVSREAVEYILNELDLSTFLETLSEIYYASDEYLWATLSCNDNFELPGGFTRECFPHGNSFTRTSVWTDTKNVYKCKSKQSRHDICIYGLEDIYKFAVSHDIFANKIMPDFDFGALECTIERLYNRSNGLMYPREGLDLQYYENLSQVRYMASRIANGGIRPDNGTFICGP